MLSFKPTFSLLSFTFIKRFFSSSLSAIRVNRFKGLDLIDRVPEELWTKVNDIVYEAVIETIPRKRNAKRQNGCLRRPYK